MLSKKCSKCKQELPLTDFRRRGGEKYLRSECKNCNNQLQRERSELKKQYGKPPENYTCPICERNEVECAGEGSKIASSWVLDHCHTTKKFRGWLCHKCNRGLGAFGDSKNKIVNALNYLLSREIQ
jgi:5-methylcytosine-specific restriction endonuclease McrA